MPSNGTVSESARHVMRRPPVTMRKTGLQIPCLSFLFILIFASNFPEKTNMGIYYIIKKNKTEEKKWQKLLVKSDI